jgi:hypothetical protein
MSISEQTAAVSSIVGTGTAKAHCSTGIAATAQR